MALLGLIPDAMMLPILITVIGIVYLVFLQGLLQPFFGFKDDALIIIIVAGSWLLYYVGINIKNFFDSLLNNQNNAMILAGIIVFGSALIVYFNNQKPSIKTKGRRKK